MKFLLSVYACHPYKGSEPGLGWENFVESSQKYPDITILTRKIYQKDIESHPYFKSLDRVKTLYYELPSFLDKMESNQIGFQLHPYVWEVFVFFFLLKELKKNQFDLAQKATTGSYRFPSLVWYFSKKFIWGPLASGERYSFRLIRIFSLKGQLRELFRMLVQRIVFFDPLIFLTLVKADKIITISEDSKSIMPAFAQKKATVNVKYISIKPEDYKLEVKNLVQKEPSVLKLLFIGRMQEWKGVMFGLQALKKIHGQIPYEFTLVGDGPDRPYFEQFARQHHLNVKFVTSWVERRNLSDFYFSHNLFMFPCLHAVTGYVFLESLLHDLPVLALDITGAKELVGDNYGIEICTKDKSKEEVVSQISMELVSFFNRQQLNKNKDYSLSSP